MLHVVTTCFQTSSDAFKTVAHAEDLLVCLSNTVSFLLFCPPANLTKETHRGQRTHEQECYEIDLAVFGLALCNSGMQSDE